MANQYLKTTYVMAAVMFSLQTLGQSKIQTDPDFRSPFKSKISEQQSPVIHPAIGKVQNDKPKRDPKIELLNGSFTAHLEGQKLKKDFVSSKLADWLSLNSLHSFQQISEKTDDLGITHTNFIQHFKGFPVDGTLVMLHSKNGFATSINGQIGEFSSLETEITVTADKAILIAKAYLKVNELINEYPVETVIAKVHDQFGIKFFQAHKVRIDSYSPFEMCYVYVDAQTGKVRNKINLNAHADVPGTGQTLYSGSQSITWDSYSGYFRLRDNARNIETYDATHATNGPPNVNGFSGSTDYTHPTTNHTGIHQLSSFTISVVAQSWWYAVFADVTPDLYIKVKDGSNQLVYTSGYYDNQNPVVTFNNLNLYLTNPPYTVEVWDYDAGNADDFGGSYTISSSVGSQSWAGNGNNGSYSVTLLGHPAIDVHWGMEKSYDFYLNTFNRESYDGNGSKIRQYLNPPSLQSQYGNDPNNAGAYAAPYNFMVYGMGDGQTMNPVVGIDVEGHEFSHMVINHNGNGGLIYQGESGALNESFADIFGACIEFYTLGSNANWTIGEDVMVTAPFLRSMSNPKARQHPNTFQGVYWQNPTNLAQDKGGVHTNSGVQNYWFYLLSQGGSGTNDLNNSYSVSGIGINQASQIAYRNLITYLGPNATYFDAYNGSLQAAEDLFGNPSTQYTAVRKAWYAVGIGNDPDAFCSGTSTLKTSSGTITDGSGTADYRNNAHCKWVISPPGATQISLNFTAFDTESEYDTVFVYNGPDDTYPVLATWWGNTLPPTINTGNGVGAMCVKFTSDNIITSGGWSANYTATGTAPSCDGVTALSDPSGSFSDGSGTGNYGNNQLCYWFIAPPCATTVTLSFSQFNTEQNYDGVIIYDGWGTTPLAVYTGTTIPTWVTSNTGEMLVIFISDYSSVRSGFTANYTSTGSAHCSGTINHSTTDYGTITDGSGSNDYCNNLDCHWLIQPPQATSVTLNFSSFDLEQPSSDGQTIFDAVEVYDGSTTSSPLLGVFAGDNIPSAISSTGGSMLVRFRSDMAEAGAGWSADYTSTQNTYCSGNTLLTATTGTFADGSGADKYSNNSNCSWLIQPTNATSITLSFSAFDTENSSDGVVIYDGTDNSAPVIGQFSGSTIPNPVTSTGGSLYVQFLTDPDLRANGWSANYTSTIMIAPVTDFDATSTDICEGTCINFTDNSINNPTSWNWSFPGATPSSSNVQNPSNICYNSPGTYNVILTSSNAAGNNTKTRNSYITVKELPTKPAVTATPSLNICDGETVTLTVSNPCTGCNYEWIPNGETAQTIQVTSSDNYVAKASNGCGNSSSDAVQVTVNSLPPIPTISVNGNELTSSSATGNQWYFKGAIIPSANQQKHMATQSGDYSVEVTDINECSRKSTDVSVTITGVDDIPTIGKVRVFPNPSNGILNIESDWQQTVMLEIIDMVGRTVLTEVPILHGNSIIDASEFSKGVYLIKITSGKDCSIFRIIIQ